MAVSERPGSVRPGPGSGPCARGVEDGGEQDVLAALDRVRFDAEQREQSGDRRADALLERGRVAECRGIRCGKRAQDRKRPARIGARRVDRDLGGVAEPPDALAVLVPIGEPLAPRLSGRCREVLDGFPLRAASPASTQGLKSSAAVPESEEQVADVALRSMAMAAIPSSAASSSSDTQSPVLPLPVMPMQTACVVSHASRTVARRRVARISVELAPR